jgi:hypothetical protein
MPSPGGGLVQPPRQLKGFTRVELEPGQARRVTFDLDERAFSYWDTRAGGWRVAPGCYRIAVGAHSRDAAQTGIVGRGAECPGALQLPRDARSCTSRRRFAIRLPRGARRAGARVTVAGRRAKVVRRSGRLRATIDLRGRRAGRVVVRVRARKGGRVIRQTRVYRTCARRNRG